MGNGLRQAIVDNAGFALVALVTVAVLITVAYFFEKMAARRAAAKAGGASTAGGRPERVLTTRKVVMIGMFSAIAGVLHCLDFAVPFAPPFYKLDFSELAALIGGFAFGPVASVLIEFLKIMIKLVIKSTSTAFVGDLANFLIGCMLVLPASVIYQFRKSKKNAIIGCISGTVIMTVFGTWFNAVYLLPTFSRLFHMDMDVILGMGQAINPGVKDLTTFVILMVAPLNIVKGVVVSVITMLIYKPLSPIIKYGSRGGR